MSFTHDMAQHTFPNPAPVHEIVFTPNEIEELLTLFQSPAGSSFSGSEGSTRSVYSIDERKRRRMISNRESARRSRRRKKTHLENLTERVNRLKEENRELKNRLGSVLNHGHLLWRVNDRLISESVALRARLSNLCNVLYANAMHQSQ
ncbi:hypothetical protein K2173_007901 [Erythroxylum novogranatense]|uniref:BZIP domain-containing protein n=1 Tax=Erythroxylum novogranatense TaxID=1862640 RepID=A0AAV8T6Q3_9ROSI|nr:hypothetical protein K2173_007901 [Erythroxylum novogranatense]